MTDAALSARIAAKREALEALHAEHRAAFRRIAQIEQEMVALRGTITVLETRLDDPA